MSPLETFGYVQKAVLTIPSLDFRGGVGVGWKLLVNQ